MKTNPFRELVNRLQQIRKEPLSKEQLEKINSVLEENCHQKIDLDEMQ